MRSILVCSIIMFFLTEYTYPLEKQDSSDNILYNTAFGSTAVQSTQYELISFIEAFISGKMIVEENTAEHVLYYPDVFDEARCYNIRQKQAHSLAQEIHNGLHRTNNYDRKFLRLTAFLWSSTADKLEYLNQKTDAMWCTLSLLRWMNFMRKEPHALSIKSNYRIICSDKVRNIIEQEAKAYQKKGQAFSKEQEQVFAKEINEHFIKVLAIFEWRKIFNQCLCDQTFNKAALTLQKYFNPEEDSLEVYRQTMIIRLKEQLKKEIDTEQPISIPMNGHCAVQ